MKRAAAIAVLALATPTLAMPTRALAESQTWKIIADVGGQPVRVTCVLEAADGKLAGPCTSDLSPEQAKASGAYTATTSELVYDINAGGQTMHIVYKGEVQPDGSMKGTVDVGGMAGTFTASR